MKRNFLLTVSIILVVGFVQSAFAGFELIDTFSFTDRLSSELPVRSKQTATITPTPSPTMTPFPLPSVTATFIPATSPAPTLTPTYDCGLYQMSDFEITENNFFGLDLTNHNPFDDEVVYIQVSWQSAQNWAEVLGYNDFYVDRAYWNGVVFYSGDDYNTPTNISTNLLLPAGTPKRLEIDFDWPYEQSWALLTEFGLTQENFGIYIELASCVALERPEIISVPPTPDCNAYTIDDFYFEDFGHVLIDITNNDLFDTHITGIEFDWNYAENYDALADPQTEINVDFMRYNYQDIWGDYDGGVRDFDSTTNTIVDSPETFPGGWSPGLPPFVTKSTHTLEIDFDDEWPAFPLHLRSNDFGITFAFENGCTLTKATKPRPLPNQNP